MAGFDLRGGKPGNYVLGRGKLYLAGDSAKTTAYAAGTANSQTVWRDVGNVTGFTITQESETKEHRSSLQGLQVVDLEVPVSQKMSVGFVADEINAINLARFLSGTYIGLDNDTGTVALANGAAIDSDNAGLAGVENYFVDTDTTDRVTDVWYDMILNLTALGTPEARCIDFESQADQPIEVWKNPTARNNTAGGTQLTEGTHYEIDRKLGRIRFYVVAGGITAGDSFVVIWDAPSVPKGSLGGLDDSLFAIKPLTSSGVTVGVKFIQENANDGDIPLEFQFWQVKLKPDGEYAGVGDDWAQVSFTGVVESIDTPGAFGSSYGRVLGRDSFST